MIVDVVVDNGKGAPVTGLKAPDFEILEDGKPQTVNFFEEHASRTLPASAVQALPPMPPNVFTNVPAAPQTEAVNVLLIDTLNTPQPEFSYARNQVMDYLNHVQPGTRIAVFTLGEKLNFVQGFTADPAALAAAVKDRKKGANPSFSQPLVSRSDVSEVNGSVDFLKQNGPGGAVGGLASSFAADEMLLAFDSYKAFAERSRTLMTLEALDYLARYLSEVPGRKNLIWFSGTFPVVIFPKYDQMAQFEQSEVPPSRIRATADRLTAARIAVYPVSSRGVMLETTISADSRQAGNDPGNGSHMATNDPMATYAAESSERAGVIIAMNQIAHDTGGKAIYNTNDLSTATARAIDDGARYYTLSYTPTNKKMDGNYRSVEVKVNGAKYKLSYRHGYNATDPNKEPQVKDTDPLRSLLRPGLPAATELLYGLRAVAATPQPAPDAKRAGKNDLLNAPVTRYSLDFMIRWTDVKLTEAPDGTHTGKILVELTAFDSNGKPVNWEGVTQQMNLTPQVYASIQQSGLPAHLDIDLPNAPVRLVTGVYDWSTGKTGTLEIPIIPGAAPATPHAGAR